MSRAPRLLVATGAGVLYVYALDAAEGGECTLLRTHRLLDAAPHHHAEGTRLTRPPHAHSLAQTPALDSTSIAANRLVFDDD